MQPICARKTGDCFALRRSVIFYIKAVVPIGFNTDDIRQAFSKGSVVFSHDGISVCYTFKDDWVTQTLQVKTVFETLLNACSGFSVIIRPGQIIRLVFAMELPVETMTIYPPVTEEIQISLDELIDSLSPEEISEFNQFFCGTDFSNKDEVFDRLSEFIRKKEAREEHPDIIPTAYYNEMRRIMQVILNCGFYCEADSWIASDGTGCFNFTIDERSHIPAVISGKLKASLVDLMQTADYFGFECSVQEGVIIFGFST